MNVTTNELLLALRAPTSGWLAALILALNEAQQDPDFSEQQRDMVKALLDNGSVPGAVANAAGTRLDRFEAAVQGMHAELFADPMATESIKERPQLTLCG